MRKSRKGFVLVGLLAATIVALMAFTACGTPSNHEDNGDVFVSHISLSEWEISGAHNEELALYAGKGAIEIHNAGVTVHQLAIWKGGKVEGDEVHGGTLIAETDVFGPGKLVMLEVELEEGAEYILTCPIPGHTAAGMAASAVAVSGHGHEIDDDHHDEGDSGHRGEHQSH